MTTSEMLSTISKLRRELNVVISERDEALQALTGWENKWKAAVEMAARAENERDEWAAMCGRYKQERDEARKDLEFRRGLYKVQKERLDRPKWYNGREIPADIKEETK